MANRNFSRVQTLDREIKFLFGQALVTDTTGAVTLNESLSAGIKSFAYVAQGVYDITLGVPSGTADIYPALIYFGLTMFNAAEVGTTGAFAQLQVDTVSTDGVFRIMTLDHNFGAQYPRNASKIKFVVAVKNSDLSAVGRGVLTE
tara:strand:+ start:563 stop:997 length:435 start_codon:yes stop_codon:yes gene_type:complete